MADFQPNQTPDAGDGSRARLSPEVMTALILLGSVTVLFSWWAWKQGAYFGTVFFPGAIAIYLLISLFLLFAPFPGRVGGPVGLALGAATLLAAWALLSILWTPVPAAAVVDAEQALFYAAMFLVGLWATRLLGRARLWALGPPALAGAAVGIATVIVIATGTDFNWYLHDDATLRFPIGYRNANAAFFLICLWPLIGLATANSTPWYLRAAAVAAATMLLELAVLAQSRGSLPATAVALLVYLLLAPHRLRAAAVIVLAAFPMLPAMPVLLAVFRHGEADAAVGPLLRDAAGAIGVSAVCSLLLAAVVLRLVYPRMNLGAARTRLISRVAAVIAILGVTVAGSVYVAERGGPLRFVDQRVGEFAKVGYPDLKGQGVRFGANVGSNRYDFWRVALDQAGESPAIGGGAGSFEVAYLEQRRSGESPKDPHSIELRLLGELGLVGLLALLAFLVGALLAALRSRGLNPDGGILVAAAVGGGAQWLFHGSYDWFWQYTAVTAPAFYLLGSAAASTVEPTLSRGMTWSRALAACALVIAALIATPLFLAERYMQRALGELHDDPAAALSDLSRAADLNPLDDQPLLQRGAIASNLGERQIALAAFREASSREPENYAPRWFLARELLAGNPSAAADELARARELNPRGLEILALDRKLRASDRGAAGPSGR